MTWILLTRWYKYASMGLGIFGLYLVTKHAILYLMERRRRWELQKRYDQFVYPLRLFSFVLFQMLFMNVDC